MSDPTRKTCTVDGCNKRVRARGLCGSHYNADRASKLTEPCNIDGCTEIGTRAQLCGRHYRQRQEERAPRCSIDGCDSPRHSHGLCQKHNRRRRQANPDFVCTIDGCERPLSARGLCSTHYLRWWKYGDTDQAAVRYDDPERQFRESYEVTESGCWEWTGWVESNGYARFKEGGKRDGAHRWSYERFVGPIPEGLQIDHLCFNRKCVNPEHLEPVTAQENIRRARERAKNPNTK